MSKYTATLKNQSLSVIIPAYNDSDTITQVIQESYIVAKKHTKDYEILVLDDGSTDRTYKILEGLVKKIPHLILKRNNKNKGFGKAIKKLYYSASKELIFSLPGNGQIKAGELQKLLPYIKQYDMIIGTRKLRSVSLLRKLQSKIYNLLIQFLYNLPFSDINSTRLMKRSKFRKIKLKSQSAFVDAELCYRFTRKGFKIKEVPIKHQSGPTRGGGSLKTIIPTILEIFRFWPQRGD